MNPIKVIFCIFIFLTGTFINIAQNQKIEYSVFIFDSKTNAPVHRAHVKINQKWMVSNKTGKLSYSCESGEHSLIVRISHVNYMEFHKTLDLHDYKNGEISIALVQKTVEIPVFDVTEYQPEKIHISLYRHIEDYQINQDGILLLTYPKKPGKDNSLYFLSNKNGNKCVLVPEKNQGPYSLFSDYKGRNFLRSDQLVYHIDKTGTGNCEITKVPIEQFTKQITPCVFEVNPKVVFTDYKTYYPEFRYYSFDPSDTTVQEVIHVKDEDLYHRYHMEFYWLPPLKRLEARRLAIENNWSKYDVATVMTGFTSNWYYEPLYAPLLMANNGPVLFDHVNGYVKSYDFNFKALDSCSIKYNSPNKGIKWKKKIIEDKKEDRFYTVYEKQGHSYISEIDINSGKCINSMKLHYKYVENIQVYDGFVYYIYRPFESLTKKGLFREPIVSVNDLK